MGRSDQQDAWLVEESAAGARALEEQAEQLSGAASGLRIRRAANAGVALAAAA